MPSHNTNLKALQEQELPTCKKNYLLEEVETGCEEECEIDLVNYPPHYKSESGLESIDVIEAFELNFNLGNAIKYILRCDKKGNKDQDLNKAIWYLKRELVYG